ncbi:MAG: hypothetical protein QOH57_212 [Mycobacterium sp.]|nr:hypothetical protein [Mycobacterium sp.]
MPDKQYERRAAAYVEDLRRKANEVLPPDQAHDLVADIAEHLATAGRSSQAAEETFARLGTPEALVRDADGSGDVTPRRPSRISRLRNARTIAPELVALLLLYLACFGWQRGLGPLSLDLTPAGAFWLGLLLFASPALLIVGGCLLGLSRRLTWVGKAVGIATAIGFPVLLMQIAPHLTGWNEECSSGSEVANGKLVSSYSYCINGPNWVTHVVEWIWTALPFVIMAAIGVVVVIRDRRAKSTTEAPTPIMNNTAG